MVRMAGGEHGVWRGLVPHPGGRGRHAAGAVRLHQRLLGHRGHGAHHLSGGAAHQRVRRALRRGHGPAHARRGLWLHRLHAHLADLRQLHFHLLCARSRRDGLCAGAGAGHPAHLGLPDLRHRGDSAGHARRLGHQPPAGVDAAAVAGHAGGAVCLCAAARSWCVRGHRALWWRIGAGGTLRAAPVWCSADSGHRAHHANGRAGRLSALHARPHAANVGALVARGAGGRAGLGGAGRVQDAGRRAAGLARHHPHGACGPRGGPEPDVPGRL